MGVNGAMASGQPIMDNTAISSGLLRKSKRDSTRPTKYKHPMAVRFGSSVHLLRTEEHHLNYTIVSYYHSRMLLDALFLTAEIKRT